MDQPVYVHPQRGEIGIFSDKNVGVGCKTVINLKTRR